MPAWKIQQIKKIANKKMKTDGKWLGAFRKAAFRWFPYRRIVAAYLIPLVAKIKNKGGLKVFGKFFKKKKVEKPLPDNIHYPKIIKAAHTFLMVALGPYADQIDDLEGPQKEAYFTFELGIIEWLFESHIGNFLDTEEEKNEELFKCLKFISETKYKESSELIFNFWKMAIDDSKYINERKLGFDSINNQWKEDGSAREGHAPEIYFQRAIGVID